MKIVEFPERFIDSLAVGKGIVELAQEVAASSQAKF